jgi:SAM-dependent methyltransferase
MTERAAFTPSPYQTALANQLYRRAVAGGRITLPAVPSMIEDYVKICDDVFKAIGVAFDATELAQLRGALNTELNNAFTASHRSEIVISYECPQGLVLNYHIKAQWYSIEAEYEKWLATRKPPLFGVEPDARVWGLAMEAENPSACSILDIGAGTGRNALPLARYGFAVDVIEVTAKFAQMIQKEVQNDQLKLRIFRNDIFDDIQGLRKDYQLVILSEVASDFRTSDQLRKVFELAAKSLAPEGRFVLNAFVPRDGYTPEAAAHEFGQQCYSAIFTPSDLAAAADGLNLVLCSDLSAYDYEKANLPPNAWPPTSWFEGWATGQDVFGLAKEQSPIELRWLVYRKTA